MWEMPGHDWAALSADWCPVGSQQSPALVPATAAMSGQTRRLARGVDPPLC